MSNLLESIVENSSKFNKIFDLPSQSQTDKLVKNLNEGLNSWGTWFLQNKKLVKDHITRYFHFRKHELKSIKEVSFFNFQLAKLRDSNHFETLKLANNFKDKQKKLWISRNIEKWKIDSKKFKEPLEDIFSNFHIASKYILPDERAKLKVKSDLSSLASQKMIAEYILFTKRDQKRIKKNFYKFSKEIKNSTLTDVNIKLIKERLIMEYI